jgi:hypothetical protein
MKLSLISRISKQARLVEVRKLPNTAPCGDAARRAPDPRPYGRQRAAGAMVVGASRARFQAVCVA